MVEIETPEQQPQAGDLLEFYQERWIPTGTWHVDLEQELDDLGAELARELTARGIWVGYNSFKSHAEAGAFSYTLTVALRVHRIVEVEPEEPGDLQAGVPVWAVVVAVGALVGLALSGWVVASGARIAEAAPEALEEIGVAAQLAAVALALLALAAIARSTRP